jgi:hypothetical protein
MGWSEWMVPEFRDEQEFALQVLQLELRDTIVHNPEEVIALCVSLSRLTSMQDSIIRKATRRITELELGQAIAEPLATTPPARRGRSCGPCQAEASD